MLALSSAAQRTAPPLPKSKAGERWQG